MKRRLLPLLAIVFFACSPLLAQQLSLFTQYRENFSIINPAAVESDFLAYGYNLTFGASYRAQWVGLSGGPRTQTVRGSYLNTEWSGVTLLAGGHIINDVTGPTGFTGVYGRLGGVIGGDPEYSGLALGISGGIVQFRVDADKIKLRDQGDVIGTQTQTQLFPDVGVGLFFYTAIDKWDGDYFYVGASMPQVFGLDLTFQEDNGEYSIKRVQHIYGQIGLIKFLNNDGFLEPSVWIKYTDPGPINADINLRYQLPSSIWIGTGISTAGNFHIDTGFLLGENAGFENAIKLGYGFDYSFSSFGPTAGSTHELNLTFSFDR